MIRIGKNFGAGQLLLMISGQDLNLETAEVRPAKFFFRNLFNKDAVNSLFCEIQLETN